jgi:hypothetical protein
MRKGIELVVIVVTLRISLTFLFSKRDNIHEYKVPSKYNMNFLGVFYICSC